MISVAPQRYIHEIIEETREFMVTLLATGEEQTALLCGTESGRRTDKVKELRLPTESAQVIGVPRIRDALANLVM